MTHVKCLKDMHGNQAWFYKGRLHKEDGPAYIYADGVREWWVNGDLHRTDGPAIIFPDGTCSWWYKGNPVKIKRYYQMLTGISDEKLTELVLKYGGF